MTNTTVENCSSKSIIVQEGRNSFKIENVYVQDG
jgi:hypothetical protein